MEHIFRDYNIPISFITKLPDSMRTLSFYLALITYDTDIIKYIPQDVDIRDLCMEAVRRDGMEYYKIPEWLRTDEMYIEAIKSDGRVMILTSNSTFYEEMIWLAIKSRRSHIHTCIRYSRSYELHKAAIFVNPYHIGHIPESICDLELCKLAVSLDGHVLHAVPPKYRVMEVYVIAVSQYGPALSIVPYGERTRELCLIACSKGLLDFSMVPIELRDREMCMLALTGNPGILMDIPINLRDHEICWSSVSRCASMLPFVPTIKYELAVEAVKDRGTAIINVPHGIVDTSLINLAIISDGKTIFMVNNIYKTPTMYMAALKSNCCIFSDIPPEYITENMCISAVFSDGNLLKHVPEKYRSRLVYEIAVGNRGRAIRFVPKHHRDIELFRIAIKQDPDAISYIDEAFRTIDICALALKGSNGKHMLSGSLDVYMYLLHERYRDNFMAFLLGTRKGRSPVSMLYHDVLELILQQLVTN